MDFSWVPDGSALPGRPFEAAATAVSGEKRLLILYYHNNVAPQITASPAQMADAIFGRAPSLASWLQSMSAAVLRVSNAGVFGSIRIPDATPDNPDPGMSAILTAAEDAGVPLASFARDGVFDTSAVQLVEISAWGLGGQARRPREGTSRRGIRFSGSVPWVGVTPDVNESSRMVLCHELSHQLFSVSDRYSSRWPIRGDVIANRSIARTWERFAVERIAGAGAICSGDRVLLRAHNSQYVAVDYNPPNLVNTEDSSVGDARIFTISLTRGTGTIASGSQVTFRSSAHRFMTSELGGNSSVTANRSFARSWESFEISKDGGDGILLSGETVTLRTFQGFYLVAETNGRNRDINDSDRRRGYRWLRLAGFGRGGSFDNADSNYTAIMLSLYDRIRLGWVRPRYLTPDNRGCYLLRPFLETRDALILFDPENPQEWYTVENRQYRENVDEVSSSGIVVSWIWEDEGYWQWWFNSANDDEASRGDLYPAVISAAASDVPPNTIACRLIINPDELTKRNDANAAFTTQELILPRGNGDPSRFHLSFHPMTDGNIAMCIR